MACIDRVPSGEPARVSFSSAVHKFNGSRSRISSEPGSEGAHLVLLPSRGGRGAPAESESDDEAAYNSLPFAFDGARDAASRWRRTRGATPQLAWCAPSPAFKTLAAPYPPLLPLHLFFFPLVMIKSVRR